MGVKTLVVLLLSTSASFVLATNPGLSPKKANNNDIREARLHLNGDLSDFAAYQIGGDFCRKHTRATAGLGFELTADDFLKFSAEYRQERLAYSFSQSDMKIEKMAQKAFGVAYQKNIAWGPLVSLDAMAGVSSVPGRNLGIPDIGSIACFLAGTKFYASSVGATFSSCGQASLHLALNYDWMIIDRKLNPTRRSSGLGVSAAFVQKITSDIDVEAKVELRRLFNVYGAGINYSGLAKGLVVGAFIEDVRSSYNLPNTTAVGINLTYTVGAADQTDAQRGLTEWVNIQAFSPPEVLVATDERLPEII